MSTWTELCTVQCEVLLNNIWTDVTPYVLTLRGGPISFSTGRQTELGSDNTGQGSIVLLNQDHRFTVGNTSSPYYPYFGPGRRFRVRETIGYETFDTIDAYLEIPDDTRAEHSSDDLVTVNLVDLLGRLQSAPTFISTLAEWIRYRGGTALRYYFPCTESGGVKFFDVIKGELFLSESLDPTAIGATISAQGSAGSKTITAGDGTAVIADDANTTRITSRTYVNGSSQTQNIDPLLMTTNLSASPFFIPSGQIITMVGWYRSEMPQYKAAQLLEFQDSMGTIEVDTDSAGLLSAKVTLTLTGSVTTVQTMPDQAWFPIALRYGWDTAVFELWVGSNRYVGTLTGSPFGSNLLPQTMSACKFYSGSFAHIQYYVGAPTDWQFSDYLAQFKMAQTALEQQLTGARVNSILDYAGVPAGLRDVDGGTSVMQVATLAGQTPLAALQDARATEQGRLFTVEGRVQFHDRSRVYNM